MSHGFLINVFDSILLSPPHIVFSFHALSLLFTLFAHATLLCLLLFRWISLLLLPRLCHRYNNVTINNVTSPLIAIFFYFLPLSATPADFHFFALIIFSLLPAIFFDVTARSPPQQ